MSPVGLLAYSLPIPSNALTLSFDYLLAVAASNEEYFDFYFGDLSSPIYDDIGGYNDTENAIIFAGTITKDLTDFASGNLPIAFALTSGFDDGWVYDSQSNATFIGGELAYSSVLTISNVQINPVPEPATLLLMIDRSNICHSVLPL